MVDNTSVDPRINALGVQPYAPMGGMSPQAIQAAYLKKMLEKQQGTAAGGGQQPIRSWTQVAAGWMDTLADQVNLNRMMGGAKANVAAEAESMFPGEGGHATPDGADAPAGSPGAPGGSPAAPMANQGAPPTQGASDDTLMPAMNISSRAETGKTGTAALSNISPDSAGSKSYGPWGLNSKTGSAAQFAQANPSLGITAQPGTDEFDKQWKAAAQRNPDAMLQAHQDWYKTRYLAPVGPTLTQAGVSPAIANDPRVRAYMADRKLQMGSVGQDRVMAAARASTSPEDFIHKVSTSDHTNIGGDFRTYLSSYPQNARGLSNRIDWRQGGSLIMSGQPPGQGGGGPTYPRIPYADAGQASPAGAGAPQMAAPSPGGIPQPGAPAASPAQPGGMIGQSGYFVPETAISRPPMMSREQAKQAYTAAAMRGDTAGAKQIHDDYIKQFLPIEVDVPGGKVRVNPGNHRDQHFIPALEKATEKGPGGIEQPVYNTISPTGQVTKLPTTPQGAGGAAPSAPAASSPPGGGAAPTSMAGPGGSESEPYPENGSMADKVAWSERQKVREKGQLTSAEEGAKAYNRIYEGAMGLGNTGAKVANVADGLLPIVKDPDWSKGGGLPQTQLAIKRLAINLGMDSNAPAMEVVQRGLGIIKNYWQEGMKSNTSVLGEQARLFQSEINALDPIVGSLSETQKGLGSGLQTISRLGNHWRENADAVDEHVNKNGIDRRLNKLLRDREADFHLYTPGSLPPNEETVNAAKSLGTVSGAGAAGVPGAAPPGSTPAAFSPSSSPAAPSSFAERFSGAPPGGGPPLPVATQPPGAPSPQSLMRRTIRNIGPQANEAGLVSGAHEPSPAEMSIGAGATLGAPFAGHVANALMKGGHAAWKNIPWIPKLIGGEEIVRYLLHGGK